jgi:DNA adenine methylase
MTVNILPSLPRAATVVLGDMDYGVVCYWRTVYENPAALCRELLNFRPSVAAFEDFKARDGQRDADAVTLAFRKFALHQMSFSGLGAKAGGPIGGRKQRSDYAVNCRFNPERHAYYIERQHKLLKNFAHVEVVEGDFVRTLEHVPDDGFVYLDPPYYLQGGALYKHNMTPADHARLADCLKSSAFSWVLSYDDHPAVRDLYAGWADINEFQMTATIDTKKGAGARRKNNELVITKAEA